MKRFIMPLAAFLVAGTIILPGCNGKDDVPGDDMEPAVVDTMTPPTNVDTLVVDTAGTGTEVKVVDGDSAKATTGGKTRTQSKPNVTTSPDGNTGTRRPQRNDEAAPQNTAPAEQPVQKSDDASNTGTRRPQRP